MPGAFWMANGGRLAMLLSSGAPGLRVQYSFLGTPFGVVMDAAQLCDYLTASGMLDRGEVRAGHKVSREEEPRCCDPDVADGSATRERPLPCALRLDDAWTGAKLVEDAPTTVRLGVGRACYRGQCPLEASPRSWERSLLHRARAGSRPDLTVADRSSRDSQRQIKTPI
jgi:hypothetical protein